jgi:hypothetical protein
MNCPWCGGNKITHNEHVSYTAPYLSVELHGAKIPMQTIALFSTCECGLIFQENKFSDKWYEWFYSSGTYRQTLGISQEEMDADEQRRADDLVEWLSVFDEMNINHHCDIGSSRGYLMENMRREYQCSVYGVEPNSDYKSIVESGYFSKPDLVSAIHVLEHVTDPIKELTTWANMTSKYLLIEVPGLNTVGGPLRFAHLYYFPPELLKAKINELGFDIVAMETEPNTRIFAKKIDK